MASKWFESVRRPASSRETPPQVRLRGPHRRSEKGLSSRTTWSLRPVGFAPHVAGNKRERTMATTVMGQSISLPVLISPTGVQAVHRTAKLRWPGRGQSRRRDGAQLIRQSLYRKVCP